MASAERSFANYREFWPYYVGEHRLAGTRRLHFVGTTAGLLLIAAAIATGNAWLLLGVPVSAYGPAWFGHFFIEKNRPATFRHPFLSLRGDAQMYALMWAGRMEDEVRKLPEEPPVRSMHQGFSSPR